MLKKILKAFEWFYYFIMYLILIFAVIFRIKRLSGSLFENMEGFINREIDIKGDKESFRLKDGKKARFINRSKGVHNIKIKGDKIEIIPPQHEQTKYEGFISRN